MTTKDQDYITASELAGMYGYSRQNVDNWREMGMPYNTNIRKIPRKAAIEWVVKNVITPLRDVDVNEEIKQERLRKVRSEANISILNEREAAGALIPVAYVESAIQRYASMVKTSMLQIASTQAGALVEAATDTRSMKAAMTTIITERLTEIGKVMDEAEFLDDPELDTLSEDVPDDAQEAPEDDVEIIAEAMLPDPAADDDESDSAEFFD